MTIMVANHVAMLSGRCGAEDAEPLLLALQDDPSLQVDLGNASRLHTAVVQILLVARPVLRGVEAHPMLQAFILPGTAED